MTDTPLPNSAPVSERPVSERPVSERIAKVIARSGVASRRDAEKMILEGRVSVNGKKIASPALDVLPTDKVAIDGKPIDAPQETRVWLYYKPLGLVTTEKDEQGRRTIFDEMPEGMPRVLNVGRLDLNSEGLLLLTNDGGLKRRLELPETGWLRKYRVRVNGRPMDDTFRPLREGITIDGEDFQPMEVTLDRQQGANAWLTVGIREGKNREIRRAMAAVNMTVNRLIRVSYGPFRLNDMQPGDVIEVKRKLLRDQLGDRLLTGAEDGRPSRAERMAPKPPRARRDDEGERPARRGPARDGAERGERKGFGHQRDFAEGSEGARKPRFAKEGAPRGEGFKPRRSDEGEDKRPYSKRPSDRAEGEKRPYAPRPPREGDEGRKGGFGKAPRSFGAKSHRDESTEGKRPYTRRDETEGRKPRAEGFADRKPRGEGYGDKKPYQRRDGDAGGKPGFKSAGFKSHGGKPGAKPRAEGFKSHAGKAGTSIKRAPRGEGKPGPKRG